MKIPDDMWRCPKCGVGYMDGEGLVHDPQEVSESAAEDEYSPDDDCYCGQCNWVGYAKEIYEAALKRLRRKPCPHCGGKGWVEGREVEP